MTLKLNIKFIQHLTQNDLLGCFYYFIRLKYKYSNSLYYNFNINKIAKSSSISHSAMSRKINFFLSRGWCYIDRGHLKFVSISNLYKIEKLEVKTYNKVLINLQSKKQTILSFQRLLLEDNIRKQKFIIRKKQDLINPTNLKDYKSARKWAANQKTKISGEIADTISISVSGLANLFHCSNTTAQRIKEQFKKNNWFDFIRQIKPMAYQVTKKAFKKYFQPYFDRSVFYFKGIVYLSSPCQVIIPEVG